MLLAAGVPMRSLQQVGFRLAARSGRSDALAGAGRFPSGLEVLMFKNRCAVYI